MYGPRGVRRGPHEPRFVDATQDATGHVRTFSSRMQFDNSIATIRAQEAEMEETRAAITAQQEVIATAEVNMREEMREIDALQDELRVARAERDALVERQAQEMTRVNDPESEVHPDPSSSDPIRPADTDPLVVVPEDAEFIHQQSGLPMEIARVLLVRHNGDIVEAMMEANDLEDVRNDSIRDISSSPLLQLDTGSTHELFLDANGDVTLQAPETEIVLTTASFLRRFVISNGMTTDNSTTNSAPLALARIPISLPDDRLMYSISRVITCSGCSERLAEMAIRAVLYITGLKDNWSALRLVAKLGWMDVPKWMSNKTVVECIGGDFPRFWSYVKLGPDIYVMHYVEDKYPVPLAEGEGISDFRSDGPVYRARHMWAAACDNIEAWDLPEPFHLNPRGTTRSSDTVVEADVSTKRTRVSRYMDDSDTSDSDDDESGTGPEPRMPRLISRGRDAPDHVLEGTGAHHPFITRPPAADDAHDGTDMLRYRVAPMGDIALILASSQPLFPERLVSMERTIPEVPQQDSDVTDSHGIINLGSTPGESSQNGPTSGRAPPDWGGSQ